MIQNAEQYKLTLDRIELMKKIIDEKIVKLRAEGATDE